MSYHPQFQVDIRYPSLTTDQAEVAKARKEATEQRERAEKAEQALAKQHQRRNSAEGVGMEMEMGMGVMKRGGVRELSLGFGGDVRGVAKEGRVERKGQGKGQVRGLAGLFFCVFLTFVRLRWGDAVENCSGYYIFPTHTFPYRILPYLSYPIQYFIFPYRTLPYLIGTILFMSFPPML